MLSFKNSEGGYSGALLAIAERTFNIYFYLSGWSIFFLGVALFEVRRTAVPSHCRILVSVYCLVLFIKVTGMRRYKYIVLIFKKHTFTSTLTYKTHYLPTSFREK